MSAITCNKTRDHRSYKNDGHYKSKHYREYTIFVKITTTNATSVLAIIFLSCKVV